MSDFLGTQHSQQSVSVACAKLGLAQQLGVLSRLHPELEADLER